MIDNRDIWRAATLRIERYGDDAPIQAAQRAHELFNRGDVSAIRSGGVSSQQQRNWRAPNLSKVKRVN